MIDSQAKATCAGSEKCNSCNDAEKANKSDEFDEKIKDQKQSSSEDCEVDSSDESKADASNEESNSESSADETVAESASDEKESERYMRLMAEFQNYKKRTAAQHKDIHAYANEKIAIELLPVMDNFERALEAGCDDPDGYVKGMKLIFEQLKTALEKSGIKSIDAVGEKFDPLKHNAVMTEDSEDYESGYVAKELQKGYTLNDKVIRPSMVSVTK